MPLWCGVMLRLRNRCRNYYIVQHCMVVQWLVQLSYSTKTTGSNLRSWYPLLYNNFNKQIALHMMRSRMSAVLPYSRSLHWWDWTIVPKFTPAQFIKNFRVTTNYRHQKTNRHFPLKADRPQQEEIYTNVITLKSVYWEMFKHGIPADPPSPQLYGPTVPEMTL